MFCLGNLMRESGVVDRLSNSAQNEIINISNTLRVFRSVTAYTAQDL